MNPLAPALPLPKPGTLETPETPQVPQHVYDLLEQAANMVGKSGLAQEEQGQITKALADAYDHIKSHEHALREHTRATAAQKKNDKYFFRFFRLISSHVREFKNNIVDPNVPRHDKMLYAFLYCFLIYVLVFLVQSTMRGQVGMACAPLVGNTEMCRALLQARRHEQAAARSPTTVAADMTFNCNDVVYDERGTKALVPSMMYVWKEVEKNSGDPPRRIMEMSFSPRTRLA